MYIIIIGCGKLDSTLAKALSLAGYDVSVIDHDSKNLNVLGSGDRTDEENLVICEIAKLGKSSLVLSWYVWLSCLA
jgi:Trk K+ transport system NAD-binding subunit